MLESYHFKTVKEVLDELRTGDAGLSTQEAIKRLSEYGHNLLQGRVAVSPVNIFLGQFKSILIVILIFAALVSGFLLHEYLDMYVILIIVLLNAVISFVQEYRAEKAVDALKKMVSPSAIVLRDGHEVKLERAEIDRCDRRTHADLEDRVTRNSEDAANLFASALCAKRAGQFELAEKRLAQALQLSPSTPAIVASLISFHDSFPASMRPCVPVSPSPTWMPPR